MNINRRELLGQAAIGGSLLSLGSPFGLSLAQAQENTAPHFFFTIYVQGGMDSSYLFDARPNTMTDAGKIQNYLNEDPGVWDGVNGQVCRSTRLTQPLRPFKDRLTIINGVLMATSFDGHDQNLNYLFTGNPFGGESFVPHLNHGLAATPLDFIQSGSFPNLQISNGSSGVPLEVSTAKALKEKLSQGSGFSPNSPMLRHVHARIEKAAKGAGSFARGSREMGNKWSQVFDLAEKFKKVELVQNAASESRELQFARLALAAFKTRISGSATLSIMNGFDVHDAPAAQQQPQKFTSLASTIAEILTAMRDTSFDEAAGLNFLDVTTVMVVSEFGRTMRQRNLEIRATGTDHNPYTNSVLMIGKGVRPGCVIGASDLATVEEEATGAHRSVDSELMKIMGRPFDFDLLAPRSDRPETFKLSDYLTFASIANGIYEMFGVDQSKHWLLERNGGVARPLRGVLG